MWWWHRRCRSRCSARSIPRPTPKFRPRRWRSAVRLLSSIRKRPRRPTRCSSRSIYGPGISGSGPHWRKLESSDHVPPGGGSRQVQDGQRRDLDDMPLQARPAIPAYHTRPAPPTNLTRHQALDINVPIGCGDAPVFPGDVIVGDAEGVVVIPAHLAAEIADDAFEMTAFEDFVAEEVRGGRSILGLYPATEEETRTDFAAWRKANAR